MGMPWAYSDHSVRVGQFNDWGRVSYLSQVSMLIETGFCNHVDQTYFRLTVLVLCMRQNCSSKSDDIDIDHSPFSHNKENGSQTVVLYLWWKIPLFLGRLYQRLLLYLNKRWLSQILKTHLNLVSTERSLFPVSQTCKAKHSKFIINDCTRATSNTDISCAQLVNRL